MADPRPTDPAALKAWYKANFQIAGDPSRKSASDAESAPATKKGSGALQPLPVFTADDLETARTDARESRRGTTDPSPDAAARRRQQADLIRTQARKKALRWRFLFFCLLLGATILLSYVVYLLIQYKFDGKIPYFQSLGSQTGPGVAAKPSHPI